MATVPQEVLEPYARHAGTATLYINGDASWSVGPNAKALIKVTFGDIKSINDSTFGFSAVAAERTASGGYKLFVRSDIDDNVLVEVAVNAAGEVDAASIAVLSDALLYSYENELKVDLNNSGSFGSEPVLLEGGQANLYLDAKGVYQLSLGSGEIKPMTLAGSPLTDKLLPPGWKLVEVIPSATGFDVYAQDPSGLIYGATFDGNGAYTGGDILNDAQISQRELASGVDINGNNDLPASAGWTSTLKTASIRVAVDAALATGGKIDYAEAVALIKGVVQSHSGGTPTAITADEVSDLQALASRGAGVFAGTDANATDYLSYVFSKMVDGSNANKFFTGGNTQSVELGSLAAGATATHLERLLDKWLLGADMPAGTTAGDVATGKPEPKVASYIKSTGTLFVDGISVSDVVQGTAGTCYLIAVIGGMANNNAATIEAMIVENGAVDGSRSWGVRFFDANGKAHWVTVNDMLPADPDAAGKLAYAGGVGKNINGEIWVALIEKAYAQANALGIFPRDENAGKNSFLSIEGGQGDPLTQLMTGAVTAYSVAAQQSNYGGNNFIKKSVAVNKDDPAAMASLQKTLSDAMNAGKFIWIGVDNNILDSFGNKVLVGSHAHFAIDAAPNDPLNSTVMVYNPWGISPQSMPAGALSTEFVSPAQYTIAELVGIAGLDFMIIEALPG